MECSTDSSKEIDMNGSGSIRFSDLFADTVMTHGVVWSQNYYTKKGMSKVEFGLWLAVMFR